MMRAKAKITEEQVQAFVRGEVVELNAPQLTLLVRYLAKNTPIAILSVGNRTYHAVSIRRTPDGDDIGDRLMGMRTANVKDNEREVDEVLNKIVAGR